MRARSSASPLSPLRRPLRPPLRKRLAAACAAPILATILALVPGKAAADVRIVSVKTDTQDVTVREVRVDGRTLKEAGRSDTSLFVEAGQADSPFDCTQTLAVGLSNGRTVTRTLDLCAANYAVTVPVAETSAAETAATRVERKLLMIQTDDDTAIREVFIDGVAMPVRRRSRARVFVEMEGDPDDGGRIACRRDLRLVLADGRILKDRMDICGDWKVTMTTQARAAADTQSVRRAVPSDAGPAAPPLAGGVRRPSTGNGETALRGSADATQDTAAPEDTAQDAGAGTQDTAATASAAGPTIAPDPGALPLYDGRTWSVAPLGGDRLALVYGVPETDDRAFRASCTRGSGRMTTTLIGTVDGLREGAPVSVTLAARDVLRSYTARGSSANTEAGVSEPVVTLAADDPIWTALIRGSELTVAMDGTWAYRVSLTGSAGPVRRFVEACAVPAPEIVAAPDPSGGFVDPGAAGFAGDGASCADEGFIRSVPSSRPATLIFRNERQRPVVVHWIDFDGDRRMQARIPPGGEMVQPTVAGHPWLVANLRGRCLGIYLPRGASRTVTLRPTRELPPEPEVFAPAPLDPYPLDTFPPEPLPPEPLPPAPVPSGPLFGGVEDQLRLDYDCAGGAYLTVTIDNVRRVAVVRESGLSPVTLADRSNGPDLLYASRGYRLEGSGNRVIWTRPGAGPRSCRIF